MKILLTGGAGFIGSHLAEALLKEGHHVVVVDDFNDYYPPRRKEKNLSAVRANPRLKVVKADIRNRPLLESLFSRHRFPAVIHLAARAGVRPSLTAPLLYQDVNVGGTLLLLDAARRHGTEKFVFASSSSVYGDSAKLPLRETEKILYPVSPYGLTKLTGENLCRIYHREYGLKIAALRFFTAYGPRQRPDMAIHKFTRLLREGKKLPLFGDGTSRRDYTYISDIVAGILQALAADIQWEVFNLGGGHSVTLLELVEAIGRELSRIPRWDTLPFQAGDVKATLADVSKARKILGYRPRTTLEEGIKFFASWFREEKDISS